MISISNKSCSWKKQKNCFKHNKSIYIILEWFLKNHVTLKTGVMAADIYIYTYSIYIYIYIYIRGVNVNAVTHAINLKIVKRHFTRILITLYGLTPTSCRHRSAEGYLSCVMRVQRTSVARVAAQQAGYFENTVVEKITELWVAFFWATFIMYRGRPKWI